MENNETIQVQGENMDEFPIDWVQRKIFYDSKLRCDLKKLVNLTT